jgi:hypothetical protein
MFDFDQASGPYVMNARKAQALYGVMDRFSLRVEHTVF